MCPKAIICNMLLAKIPNLAYLCMVLFNIVFAHLFTEMIFHKYLSSAFYVSRDFLRYLQKTSNFHF